MTIQIQQPGGTPAAATTQQLAAIRSDLGVPSVSEADAAASSAAGAAITSHVNASDPHPVYLTQAEADGRYLQSGGGSAVTDGDKGDITLTGGVWAIDQKVVSNAKLVDMPAGTIKANNAGSSGTPLDLTAAQLKTLLAIVAADLSNFNEAVDDRVAALLLGGTNATVTYDDNANTLTISASAGSTSVPDGDKGDLTITGGVWVVDNAAITLAKMANLATKTYIGRTSSGTGVPEAVQVSTLKSDLALAKADVGLGNVDNTSDANKPVSSLQATALAGKLSITGGNATVTSRNGSRQVTGYSVDVNGTPQTHVVTYPNSTTIVDVGGGITRTITLDSNGDITSIVVS